MSSNTISRPSRPSPEELVPSRYALQIGDIDMITDTSDARFVTIGERNVGEMTLNRFYVLHCIGLPLAVTLLLAIHFWRVRKDGGISGPL